MINAIVQLIGESQSFLVASHAHPDGDAVGSTLALVSFLRQLGKNAVAFNLDGIPEELSFLPGADEVICQPEALSSYDVGFILDSGELGRAGDFLQNHCSKLVNVDHHPHSEPFGAINYVDEQACATGALIYRIIQTAGYSISHDVALCVYTAILSDTGSFRYSNANPEAFQIASALVEVGVSPWYVAGNLYESRPAEQIKLLSHVLETLTVSSCGRFGSVMVTTGMLQAAGARPEHTDGLINYPRSIRGVEVALFFRQVEDDLFKVSFRSKGKVDVGSLARELGGGGHHNAAGATVAGSMEQVQEVVFDRLNALLPLC
ncbi:phosphoesterase, putative [Syntrophotalea carbinolica DSM 2380]|uniref:Phosphoesterase, putative n=1 Tax=Syntrophotalea carbinolica (strain DSM 2380 / NBRC 103641 / GraBd1) TaxID=338963 RepID=Q3A4A4_SYNC1|nr:bifunctional oligoribonuclease/PAP phosphatase NrnA [Syntrophotalea carbinolica]ABA88803.1 phosphoesterase, putative [Syntrophotalea carbinolica DSM 2380]